MQITSRRKEHLLVFTVWLLIYASTPLYNYYALLAIGLEFNWYELWSICYYITAFLIVFLLNHYILVPKLVARKRIMAYMVAVASVLLLFTVFLVLNAPHFHHRIHDSRPPLPLAPPDMARLTIVTLMIGMDLGVIEWINSQQIRQRLLMLEQQNLRQELEHLRYQINPHFFMNTLNNIHVLIDIDAERAKRSIIELSGLMRYTLSEGNETMVTLSHEVNFIRQYVSLMRLRYTDMVAITCNLPEHAPAEAMIPPLLFATFVENAFKHGVSYKSPSFIDIELRLVDNNRIHFKCVNSLHAKASEHTSHHGIGLENVRKRLELLTSTVVQQDAVPYSLDIKEEADTFNVNLILPISIPVPPINQHSTT